MAEQHNENEKIVCEVDGIQELDNPLPRWYAWLYYTTIVFGVLYMAYWGSYQMEINKLEGQNSTAGYAGTRLALLDAEAAGSDTTNWEAVTGPAIDAYAKDGKAIAKGKSLFAANCAACHGAEAKGSVGPDLTDKTWKYGAGTMQDIEKTLLNGAPGGMPAQKSLGQEKIVALVAFVHSLGGGK